MSKIVVTTEPLARECLTLDTVVVVKAIYARNLHSVNYRRVFEDIKNALREECAELGGDSVVSCRIQYKYPNWFQSIFGRRVIEVMAYGTAVDTTGRARG